MEIASNAVAPPKPAPPGGLPGDLGKPSVAAGLGPIWRKTLDVLEPFAMWLFKISVVVGLCALGWLTLNILGGNLAQLPDTAVGKQLTSDVKTTALVLSIALICISLTVIIVAFDEPSTGPVTVGIGIFLWLALPALLKMQIGDKATVQAGIAVKGIVTTLWPAAYVMIFLGLVKTTIDGISWTIGLPDRMKKKANVGVNKKAEAAQQKVAAGANMFSPCWKLPFCREVIRKQCPAFLAKKRCWKFKRGCYCDEEMISRIIRGETLEAIKAPTRMSQTGKPPCGRCYIYLEHQTHKFRTISPLAFPGTIGAMFFIWPHYMKAFATFNARLDSFWARFSFSPTSMTPESLVSKVKDAEKVGQMDHTQIAHIGSIIFGVILGFMLLVWVTKFIEWAIFKAKL